MFTRIDLVKAMTQDPDGGKMMLERGLVCNRIDTVCQTADDQYTGGKRCYVPYEFFRRLSAVFGRTAGTYNGDDPCRIEVRMAFEK